MPDPHPNSTAAPAGPAAPAGAALRGVLPAAARFDRRSLSWLILLAAARPVLVVPMAAEAAARTGRGVYSPIASCLSDIFMSL